MAPLLREISFESYNGLLSIGICSSERLAIQLKSQLQESALPGTASKKRVLFNECRNEIINPEMQYYTDEDIATKWWGERNLQEVRLRARELSSKLRQLSRSHDCDLTMAHRKVTLILKKDFNSILKLTRTSPDEDLCVWCAQDDGRRGLERFTSKVYASFRKRDVSETVRAVLEEQKRQRLEQARDSEKLAQVSRTVSQRARSFANFFGAADAKQVQTKRDTESSRCAPGRKRSKICSNEVLF